MPTFKLTIDVECDLSETVSEFTYKPQEVISKLAMIDAIRQKLPNGARVNLSAQGGR
jgi:hypothetical protein